MKKLIFAVVAALISLSACGHANTHNAPLTSAAAPESFSAPTDTSAASTEELPATSSEMPSTTVVVPAAPIVVAPIEPPVVATTDDPVPAHPTDATALCNDGTYSYSKTHSGTCSHHKGVELWF